MGSLNPTLLRGISLLRLRLHHERLSFGFAAAAPSRRACCTESIRVSAAAEESGSSSAENSTVLRVKEAPKYPRWEDPDYCKWKDKEGEILRDVEPIVMLAKEILHSDRYMDGERLSAEDEKIVKERLLAYHPHSDDKIGCGIDSIMASEYDDFLCIKCHMDRKGES
ncbi:hypothetical protein ACLB2K_009861 [Fragaria x ananassa]